MYFRTCGPAPQAMLTTGYLLRCVWLNDIASTSPSVTTSFFPVFEKAAAPKGRAAFGSPRKMKSLPGNRTFCAHTLPVSSW